MIPIPVIVTASAFTVFSVGALDHVFLNDTLKHSSLSTCHRYKPELQG